MTPSPSFQLRRLAPDPTAPEAAGSSEIEVRLAGGAAYRARYSTPARLVGAIGNSGRPGYLPAVGPMLLVEDDTDAALQCAVQDLLDRAEFTQVFRPAGGPTHGAGGAWSGSSSLVSALDRIAQALERAPAGAGGPTGREGAEGAAARMREAIDAGRWAEARSIVEALHPEEPGAARLVDELTRAEIRAAEEARAGLDAAQQANDPARVLELRDRLADLLAPEPRRELDKGLIGWLIRAIQRRMLGGSIRVEVVELAAAVADRFDQTAEGAGLRASLPTLRRSAGLCPRCAGPYLGVEDACPKCLGLPEQEGEAGPEGVATVPAGPTAPIAPDDLDELVSEAPEGPDGLFVDDEG